MSRRPDRDKLLQGYIDAVAAVMLLRDWRITFDPAVHPDDDAEAEVNTNDGCVAMLYVHSVFWAKTPSEQREIIVHELGHLHTSRLRDAVVLLERAVPETSFKVFRAMLSDADEHAVQMFARILAPAIQLPPRFE